MQISLKDEGADSNWENIGGESRTPVEESRHISCCPSSSTRYSKTFPCAPTFSVTASSSRTTCASVTPGVGSKSQWVIPVAARFKAQGALLVIRLLLTHSSEHAVSRHLGSRTLISRGGPGLVLPTSAGGSGLGPYTRERSLYFRDRRDGRFYHTPEGDVICCLLLPSTRLPAPSCGVPTVAQNGLKQRRPAQRANPPPGQTIQKGPPDSAKNRLQGRKATGRNH